MTVEILTDVDTPARKQRASKYPWVSLDVGQAFFAPKVKTVIKPGKVDGKFKIWNAEREGIAGVYVKRIS